MKSPEWFFFNLEGFTEVTQGVKYMSHFGTPSLVAYLLFILPPIITSCLSSVLGHSRIEGSH